MDLICAASGIGRADEGWSRPTLPSADNRTHARTRQVTQSLAKKRNLLVKRKADSAPPTRQPKLSRTYAPPELAPVDWQRALRRQFGREQVFGLKNLGAEPFFSDFRVSNPQSKSVYRVAIRGLQPGDNFCACPDYATNELGTCKHIEFTLARLAGKRGAKAAFARGYQPEFSELYLRTDGERAIHFRAGTEIGRASCRERV